MVFIPPSCTSLASDLRLKCFFLLFFFFFPGAQSLLPEKRHTETRNARRRTAAAQRQSYYLLGEVALLVSVSDSRKQMFGNHRQYSNTSSQVCGYLCPILDWPPFEIDAELLVWFYLPWWQHAQDWGMLLVSLHDKDPFHTGRMNHIVDGLCSWERERERTLSRETGSKGWRVLQGLTSVLRMPPQNAPMLTIALELK